VTVNIREIISQKGVAPRYQEIKTARLGYLIKQRMYPCRTHFRVLKSLPLILWSEIAVDAVKVAAMGQFKTA
jgi:hypothetical protein